MNEGILDEFRSRFNVDENDWGNFDPMVYIFAYFEMASIDDEGVRETLTDEVYRLQKALDLDDDIGTWPKQYSQYIIGILDFASLGGFSRNSLPKIVKRVKMIKDGIIVVSVNEILAEELRKARNSNFPPELSAIQFAVAVDFLSQQLGERGNDGSDFQMLVSAIGALEGEGEDLSSWSEGTRTRLMVALNGYTDGDLESKLLPFLLERMRAEGIY